MNETIVRAAHSIVSAFHGIRQLHIKCAVIFIGVFLSACSGWECPRLSDIQAVEMEAAVKPLSIDQLEGKLEYLNSVVEVKGLTLQ